MKETWCYYDLKVGQYRAWKEAQLHNAAYLHIPFTTSCSNAASVHFWVMHFFRATLMLHEFENIICSRFKIDICHCFNCLMYKVQIQIHNTYPSTNTRASEMLGQQQRPIVLQFGRHPHPLHLYHPHTPHITHYALSNSVKSRWRFLQETFWPWPLSPSWVKQPFGHKTVGNAETGQVKIPTYFQHFVFEDKWDDDPEGSATL